MPPTARAKRKKAAAKAKKVANAALNLAVELVSMKPKKKAAVAKKKKVESKPRAPRVRKPSAVMREASAGVGDEHDEYLRRYAQVIDRRSGRFKGVSRSDWDKWFERDPVSKRVRRRDVTREWPVHKQIAARASKEPKIISTVPLRPEKEKKKKKAAAAKKKAAEPKAMKVKKAAAKPKAPPKKKKSAAKPKARTLKRAALPEGMEWIESSLNAAGVPAPGFESVHKTSTPLPPPPDDYPAPPPPPLFFCLRLSCCLASQADMAARHEELASLCESIAARERRVRDFYKHASGEEGWRALVQGDASIVSDIEDGYAKIFAQLKEKYGQDGTDDRLLAELARHTALTAVSEERAASVHGQAKLDRFARLLDYRKAVSQLAYPLGGQEEPLSDPAYVGVLGDQHRAILAHLRGELGGASVSEEELDSIARALARYRTQHAYVNAALHY